MACTLHSAAYGCNPAHGLHAWWCSRRSRITYTRAYIKMQLASLEKKLKHMARKVKKLTEREVCVCVCVCMCVWCVWVCACVCACRRDLQRCHSKANRKEVDRKKACGCIANTQMLHCACQRVHGRIGKDCMWMVLISNTEARTYLSRLGIILVHAPVDQ